MLKKIKNEFRREMIRPLIYKCFTRFVLTLFVLLMWHRFVPQESTRLSLADLMSIAAAFYVLCLWLAYLRLKGLNIPRINLKMKRHKEPARLYGDMSDYTDEEIWSFDELEKSEQDICVFLADAVLVVIFAVAALVV